MSNVVEMNKGHGYMPRTLNTYEAQMLKGWDNPADVIGLIDGWVRTVAIATDLKTSQIDTIVDKITEHVRLRREDMLSPTAVIDEIRRMMADEGLVP